MLVSLALLILFPNLLLLLLRQFFKSLPSPHTPSWVRLVLLIDTAVEFPLIFAFHPATIIYRPCHSLSHLKSGQILLQVVVFFATELALETCLLSYIKVSDEIPDPTRGFASTTETHDDDAKSLVIYFLRPRATLLLATALMGMPTSLTTYTGQLHPISMILWVVLGQLVGF